MPDTLHFRALALVPELNLKRLAEHMGVRRRFTWDEPLELAGQPLQALAPGNTSGRLFLFSFGAIVFVDFGPAEIREVLQRLGEQEPGVLKADPFQWSDEYALTVDRNAVPHCDTDGLTMMEPLSSAALVLATVLAKSVALERVEATLETVLDRSEKQIDALERGQLRGADATLARDAGAVLRIEHESIHYLGLLDKPDVTWTDETADALYSQLARQFELRERFAGVRHRIDVLKDLGSTFANLAHARRSARLEWIIILLIAFEIVLPAGQWLWKTLVH